MKRPFILYLAVVAAASLACSLSGGGATAEPGVIYQDDFSDSGSGWSETHDDTVTAEYANGAYNIVVNTTQYDAWTNPDNETFPDDVTVEVDATKNGGPDENDFGPICRYSDTDNFYYFHITSDGYAVIGKVTAGEQFSISGDEYEPAGAINTGNATNHIRADCIGETLTLYVNGQQVLSATDSDHPSGIIGLMAGTFDTAGADISFDNVVVKEP